MNRSRKILIMILLLSLILNVGLITLYLKGRTPGDKRSEVGGTVQEYYVCPMHPQVISDRPGDCPICGMKLVKRGDGDLGKEIDEEVIGVSLSPAQEVLANVKTGEPIWMEFSPYWELPAVVTYDEGRLWQANTRTMGRVERLYVNLPGEVVEIGDPIYDLYSPDLNAAQEEFLLALKSANLSVRESLVEAARRKMLSLGAEGVHIYELERTGTVISPMTFHAFSRGALLEKRVDVGDWVMEGTTLLRFADLSQLYVEAAAPEEVASAVRIGGKVEILNPHKESITQKEEKGLIASIVTVASSLDPNTRTVTFRAALPYLGENWRVGEFLMVRLFRSEPFFAWAVPEEAVLHTGRGTVVWVEVKSGHFRPQNVVTGPRYQNMIAIVQGLEGGEKVVLSGGYLLDSDAIIKGMKGGPHTHSLSPPKEMEKREHETHSAVPHSHSHEKQPEGSRSETSEIKETKKALYTCPMHPEFVTTDPEARCPQCGMRVVRKEN